MSVAPVQMAAPSGQTSGRISCGGKGYDWDVNNARASASWSGLHRRASFCAPGRRQLQSRFQRGGGEARTQWRRNAAEFMPVKPPPAENGSGFLQPPGLWTSATCELIVR